MLSVWLLFNPFALWRRDYGAEYGEDDKDLVLASTVFCNIGVKGDHTSFYLLSNINYMGQLGASTGFGDVDRPARVKQVVC